MSLLPSLEVVPDSFLYALDPLSTLRAIAGFILVFSLPGFCWTLVFFKEVAFIERIALSFGLSIAIVTLSVIALNVLLKIPITAFTSIMVIIILTAVPLGIYYLRKRRRQLP